MFTSCTVCCLHRCDSPGARSVTAASASVIASSDVHGYSASSTMHWPKTGALDFFDRATLCVAHSRALHFRVDRSRVRVCTAAVCIPAPAVTSALKPRDFCPPPTRTYTRLHTFVQGFSASRSPTCAAPAKDIRASRPSPSIRGSRCHPLEQLLTNSTTQWTLSQCPTCA